MTEYRKQGLRTFYAIKDKYVIRIVNMETISQVDAGPNEFIFIDAKEANPCTEQEFKEQLAIAMERIQSLKIS